MPGRPLRHLRPVDLGRAVGLSAQQVNRYERWGLLPPAQRSPTGRRLYGPEHRHAILALRAMQAGYGWMPANRVMRRVQQRDLAGAVALVDERHAVLHRQRQEVAETLRALQTLAAGAPVGASARRRRSAGPAADGQDRTPRARWRASPDLLRIGEAARRAGVRASAARFWEQQGLLLPARDTESGFRLYD
ncbi:MAG TPA: MerR family DNA-binding transcriptional regulator, partial [Chloroflexota bacterium]|nr:MerR family DNA-binding transcriptional regulator [Chloroflexota bacterium]